ncbi:hypothetical protein IWX49DRAFT_212794 [Phyllosticta citricarpa]
MRPIFSMLNRFLTSFATPPAALSLLALLFSPPPLPPRAAALLMRPSMTLFSLTLVPGRAAAAGAAAAGSVVFAGLVFGSAAANVLALLLECRKDSRWWLRLRRRLGVVWLCDVVDVFVLDVASVSANECDRDVDWRASSAVVGLRAAAAHRRVRRVVCVIEERDRVALDKGEREPVLLVVRDGSRCRVLGRGREQGR